MYKTVVSSSGNINNNNCNNNNGVRPYSVLQTVRVGIKPKSVKDTKNQKSFHIVVNTKEFLLWIKILYVILKIFIKHIERLNLEKALMEVVQSFRP